MAQELEKFTAGDESRDRIGTAVTDNNSTPPNTDTTLDTSKSPTDTDSKIYPSGLPLILIVISLCTSTFLVAIDGTIIATAIPTITNDFNSLSDVAWYNASFLLTTCAFQLPWGKAYSLFSSKWVFITAIVVFEIGSAVCGASPNSASLVVGRAIAG